ncbi:unnamed protein product [Aspergillus oryzae]|uniref:Unnamed protein product n=2 Tax=Aspergillus oryzae TaxID=5062 RepID=A0AAN4YKU7_ASPOZ|nr:unnamed protein product [Aspergillus oryzae]GMF92537.1 unnamed protein product [Aspergillus oryzae]GMG03201.1 unnamed protein product [Aspergillus oryzae]GMG28994.1 unnamed protein product [Aspergillus oryzae]GMG46261.1 unnamed protein product [Aspergillus oryzae var. brunneus]
MKSKSLVRHLSQTYYLPETETHRLVTAITRSFTLVYTLSLLTIFTRIQLNLLGRRNYLSSVISMATPPANESTIRLEDHDDDDLTQTLGNDFETNRRYLAFSWWLLHRGWKQLMNEVQTAVTEVFGPLNPREDISLARLSELFLEVRKRVEGHRKWLSYLLPPREEEDKVLEESGVLGVTELANSQTAATLRHLLDETADLIESPTFTRVLMLLNNECFQTLIHQCTADAFKSTSQTPRSVPQSFTSVATVVPGADSSEPKAKLANILAVLARQAHVIGNGTNPPNLYLTAMDQGVRELEAFAAVVYSSNFDFELIGSGTKMESPGEETPGSDTVLVEKEDYDGYDRNQAQQPSTAGPGADSAFEKAWGKAMEEQPSTAT